MKLKVFLLNLHLDNLCNLDKKKFFLNYFQLNKFIKENQDEIDEILFKHNIPILSLKPGKRKKSDSTTDALIKGRAPVQ